MAEEKKFHPCSAHHARTQAADELAVYATPAQLPEANNERGHNCDLVTPRPLQNSRNSGRRNDRSLTISCTS